MKQFLILRLQGVMQAWGGHTFEDFRPSMPFPTRSAIVGFLAACLGIDRSDEKRQRALSESFVYCARLDSGGPRMRKITDFHTVLDTRKVDGSTNKHPVVSMREYLCDAKFTIAMEFGDGADFTLESVEDALRRPVYTPFLGRRSCPFTRPPLEGLVQAVDLHGAIDAVSPGKGVLYSEIEAESPNRLVVRDVPAGRRLFAVRNVFIHAPEVDDVPEQA